jgi:hypothetical protein
MLEDKEVVQPTARRPRRFRLRVGVLMVLVLLIGGGLGYVVHLAKVQHNVVAALRLEGADVGYDLTRQGRKSWAPEQMVKAIGIDFFGNVVFVRIRALDQATDATLEQIAKLDRLEYLKLNGGRGITDCGAAKLAGLTRLQYLSLQRTGMTGAGLRHLRGLMRLQELDLFNSDKIDDSGLAHLRGLHQLTSLDLSGTCVTDAGLVHLRGLNSLTSLDLSSTAITDAGLEHLRGLTGLKEVWVSETKVTLVGAAKLEHAVPGLIVLEAGNSHLLSISAVE